MLEDHKDWLKLRETRNLVTHEYPFNTNEIIEGLNLLDIQFNLLKTIWLSLKEYSEVRFNLN